MKITIEIDPTDWEDVLTHMTVIRARLKKEIKKWDTYSLQDREKDIPDEMKFSDNNCYGTHDVKVSEI